VPYVSGSPLTYTITVSNAGPSDVIGAQVVDVLPLALAGFGWTCTASGVGASCGTAAGTGDIDALVTLPVGMSVTFAVTGTVPAGITGALINTATVNPPIGAIDPVGGNNAATDTNPAASQADLTVSKVGSPNPYVAGALLSYSIVVTNAGPSNVSNARVQDALPAALAGFTWTCTASGVSASCGTPAGVGNIDALVALPVGASATFTVSGTVPEATAGTLINTVMVTPPAGVTDPVPGNNSATSSVSTMVADVAVVKSGPPSVASNGAVSYTLVVTNNGPTAANGAVVTDPAVANFIAGTVSCGLDTGGAVCPVSPTVAQLQAGLAIPILPSGGSVTLMVSGVAGVSGAIANVATVAPPAAVTDPASGNNRSTANTTIASSVTPIPTLNAATLAWLALLLCLVTALSLGRRRG